MVSRVSYSIQLAARLRVLLFAPNIFPNHKACYDVKSSELEELAKQTWAVHGVCLDCRTWTITCGRCLECGRVYSDLRLYTHASEMMMRKQVDLAVNALVEAMP